MNEKMSKSILEMARGAIMERVDYEMAKVTDNILDANTKASAKRKLTLTLELTPDDERRNISVSVITKSTLAPTNAVKTSLYVTGDNVTGEVQVVELVPEIPGQIGMTGNEQEAPSVLKLIKFA